MKVCVTCKVVKPFADFHPDKSKQSGHASMCKACRMDYMRKYYLKNKAKLLKQCASRYDRNKDKVLRTCREWVKKNIQKVRDIKRAYYERHKPVLQVKNRLHRANYRIKHPLKDKQWKSNNPAKLEMYKARRRTGEKRATPEWANEFFIQEIYDLAKRRTKMLGYKWVVDHIVPLTSDRVCGLHVEQNLRVVPEIVNLRKHNRSWPDMAEAV